MLVPGMVIALGLAGLPLTGGALAKLAAKAPLGYGVAGTVATWSAAGTALLMLHFLHRVASTAKQEPRKTVPTALFVTWLAMAVLCVVIPWAFYPMSGLGSLSDALAPAMIWKTLWPVLVGALLAVLLARWGHKLPPIPEGDIIAMAGGVARGAAGCGAALERVDSFLRQWPVATLSLLLVAILLTVTMLTGS